ncbi:MAG: hypothetical protein H7327_04900 [Herminiimonas sp.]|nr:hypothetical protein [Herminiimonas sp.]
MNDIDILVPFGLPPAELAPDLLRNMQLPATSTLLARGTPVASQVAPAPGLAAGEHDDFARALPHEAWLARRFGLNAGLQAGGSPPIAADLLRSFGGHTDTGHWFVLQPVHLHIARDHLVLTDPRQLQLSEADARILFTTAQPAFDEAGLELHFGSADYWFVRADRHADLQTATPDATCGRNIDIWMPQGDSARAWRKLQNEVQMGWYGHPVNEAREARRAHPVNSLWLWGGADAAAARAPSPGPLPDTVLGFDGWLAAFDASAAGSQPAPVVEQLLANEGRHAMLMLDALIEPALASDWGRWLERWNELETAWLAPLLAGLVDGRIGRVSLVLGDGNRLREYAVTRMSLRKFWAKPALTRLLP